MKKYLISLCFLLLTFSASAQEFLGYSNSNYAGISGAWLQPASIVDGRYKADVHLAGLSFNLNNNFYLYDAKIFSLKDSLFDDPFFYDNRITERDLKGNPFAFNLNVDVQALSFLYTLDNKNAFGFSHRLRTTVQIDGVEDDLRQLAMEEFDYDPLMDRYLINRQLSVQVHSWKEYNLHYARVIKNDDEHFLKGGIALKLLKGLSSAYVYSNELRYNFVDRDTLTIIDSDISYALSEKTTDFIDGFDIKKLLKPESTSIGFDLGLVYEYRPDYREYKYDMNGSYNMWRNDLNKYKFRAGVSLLDVGRIKYQKADGSRNWQAEIDLMDLTEFNGIKSIEDLTDTLTNRFSQETAGDTYKMQLPTALSMQFDYHIIYGFYANLTPYWGFQRRSNSNKTHAVTNYSFTPRWEHEWFDVGIPFHYDQYRNFGVGMNVRLGPFVAGVNNFKNLFKRGDSGELELYAAFKIPIQYPIPRDEDNDGVSDEIDLCPNTPGNLEHNGCPDRDKDGIPDRLDYCPDEPGLEKFNGCPDSDLDGIVDHNDECPHEAGPLYTNGCPDNDVDSIPNHTDDCPDVAGPSKFNGCPDSDNDGLIDIKDECPLTPGPIENNGCPVLEKVEQAIVNTAFGNLEFENRKAVIKKGSLSALNDLAKLMHENPDWILKLAGHTDDVGTEEFNLELSRKRATAVQSYIIQKGLSENRFKVEYFGESQPIADNETESGKQQNRRVEMKILFE